MGCSISKNGRRSLRRSPSPLPRSNSAPIHHRQHDILGTSEHIVLQTSSTLGSLELNSAAMIKNAKEPTWPEVVKKVVVPRTPTETPPNEPEAIDAWALMAGLEDSPAPPFERHSFSFPIVINQDEFSYLHQSKPTITKITNAIDEEEEEKKTSSTKITKPKEAVLYFTTLRGVRDTYEDCCLVRAVLKGYGIRIDDRDVSMHRGFRDELYQLLGQSNPHTKCSLLPSLFVDGEFIGGAEEVKRLHENGELADKLKGCKEEDRREARKVCDACGDARFVMCEICSGSCKLYIEDCDEEWEEEMDLGGGFRRCPECNENGIVRCPACCCSGL